MGKYYNLKKPIESKYPSLCTECIREGCKRHREKKEIELFDGSTSLEMVVLKKRSKQLFSTIGCTGFQERSSFSKIVNLTGKLINYAISPFGGIPKTIRLAMNYLSL